MLFFKGVKYENQTVTKMDRSELADFIYQLFHEDSYTITVVGRYNDVSFIAEETDVPEYIVVLDSSKDYWKIVKFDSYKLLDILDKMEEIQEVHISEVEIGITLKENQNIKV